jgi:serine/threonine protein phosphatase PrpC
LEEITAEFSSEELAPEVELRIVPRVTVAAKSDVGRVREINQDKFEYFLTEDRGQLASKGLVFLVCDGMGGHAAGQVASELAAKTFIDVYLNHPATEAKSAAAAAIQAANRFVLDNARAFPARRGMGTTLSGVLLVQDKAVIAQLGDSRVYRMRDGELEMLTVDHTYPNELVKLGMISPEEAAVHPQHHVLTRAIGVEGENVPDVDVHELLVGDTFMICSDGVTNHVSDELIGEVLSADPPSLAAWRLIGHALLGGGSDNATAMVVRVDALDPA